MIWEVVHARLVLGKEDCVEKLRGYVQGCEERTEIPRSQRYGARPKLKKQLRDRTCTKPMRETRLLRLPCR